MTNTEHTAPSVREIRNACRDLSEAQANLLVAVETEGRAERSSRPTRDALIRKGIVERSATGALVLTALGECVAAVLAPIPPVADDEPTAEEFLGECVVNEPGADLPERAHVVTRTTSGDYQVREGSRRGPLVSNHGRRRAEADRRAGEHNATLAAGPGADLPEATDAGFGYGLTPTAHPTPEAIVAHLVDAGMSAGTDPAHGVLAYSASPETLACALDGTGWAASPLILANMAVPGMYVAERLFRLPPVGEFRTVCPTCRTSSGSGCATCRPDSVLGG